MSRARVLWEDLILLFLWQHWDILLTPPSLHEVTNICREDDAASWRSAKAEALLIMPVTRSWSSRSFNDVTAFCGKHPWETCHLSPACYHPCESCKRLMTFSDEDVSQQQLHIPFCLVSFRLPHYPTCSWKTIKWTPKNLMQSLAFPDWKKQNKKTTEAAEETF